MVYSPKCTNWVERAANALRERTPASPPMGPSRDFNLYGRPEGVFCF